MGICDSCSCCTDQIDSVKDTQGKRIYRDNIFARFQAAGQGHVLSGLHELEPDEQKNLLTECAQFDVNLINELYEKLVEKAQPGAN